MTALEGLSAALRERFCAHMDVAAVPVGYAVNTGFLLPDGDPLSFYLIPEEDGRYHLEDDGTFLPTAVASGLDLKSPVRDSLLRGILAEEGVRYDDDLAIRSEPVGEKDLGMAATHFVAALIRLRDLTLISRENVAATFADDVRRDLMAELPEELVVDEDSSQDPFAADIVIKSVSTGLKAARIFAAGADLRMMDALAQHQASGAGDSPVIAVVDRRKGRVSEKRFNNATNLGLPMAVIDGPEKDWVQRVIRLSRPANAVRGNEKAS